MMNETASALKERLSKMEGLNQASRCKTWEEMNDPEKIAELKRMQDSYQAAITRLAKLVDQLLEHRHVENGSLVTPIKYY